MDGVATITISDPGKLGIVFEADDAGVVFKSSQAEHAISGALRSGMVLVGVQETSVEGLGARQALSLLASKSEQRPLRLVFMRAPGDSAADPAPAQAEPLPVEFELAPPGCHSQLEEDHIDELIAAEADAAATLEDRLDKLTAALSMAAAAGLADRINRQIPRLREMLHARQMETVRLLAIKKRIEAPEEAEAEADLDMLRLSPCQPPMSSEPPAQRLGKETAAVEADEGEPHAGVARESVNGEAEGGVAVAATESPAVEEAATSDSQATSGSEGTAEAGDDIVLLGYLAASRRGAVAAQAGDMEAAVKCFLHCLALRDNNDPVAAYNLSCCFAMAADADSALLWFEHAVSWGLGKIKNVDPESDPDLARLIKSDPRFQLHLTHLSADAEAVSSAGDFTPPRAGSEAGAAAVQQSDSSRSADDEPPAMPLQEAASLAGKRAVAPVPPLFSEADLLEGMEDLPDFEPEQAEVAEQDGRTETTATAVHDSTAKSTSLLRLRAVCKVAAATSHLSEAHIKAKQKARSRALARREANLLQERQQADFDATIKELDTAADVGTPAPLPEKSLLEQPLPDERDEDAPAVAAVQEPQKEGLQLDVSVGSALTGSAEVHEVEEQQWAQDTMAAATAGINALLSEQQQQEQPQPHWDSKHATLPPIRSESAPVLLSPSSSSGGSGSARSRSSSRPSSAASSRSASSRTSSSPQDSAPSRTLLSLSWAEDIPAENPVPLAEQRRQLRRQLKRRPVSAKPRMQHIPPLPRSRSRPASAVLEARFTRENRPMKSGPPRPRSAGGKAFPQRSQSDPFASLMRPTTASSFRQKQQHAAAAPPAPARLTVIKPFALDNLERVRQERERRRLAQEAAAARKAEKAAAAGEQAATELRLDMEAAAAVEATAVTAQCRSRGAAARRKFLMARRAAVRVQQFWRVRHEGLRLARVVETAEAARRAEEEAAGVRAVEAERAAADAAAMAKVAEEARVAKDARMRAEEALNLAEEERQRTAQVERNLAAEKAKVAAEMRTMAESRMRRARAEVLARQDRARQAKEREAAALRKAHKEKQARLEDEANAARDVASAAQRAKRRSDMTAWDADFAARTAARGAEEKAATAEAQSLWDEAHRRLEVLRLDTLQGKAATMIQAVVRRMLAQLAVERRRRAAAQLAAAKAELRRLAAASAVRCDEARVEAEQQAVAAAAVVAAAAAAAEAEAATKVLTQRKAEAEASRARRRERLLAKAERTSVDGPLSTVSAPSAGSEPSSSASSATSQPASSRRARPASAASSRSSSKSTRGAPSRRRPSSALPRLNSAPIPGMPSPIALKKMPPDRLRRNMVAKSSSNPKLNGRPPLPLKASEGWTKSGKRLSVSTTGAGGTHAAGFGQSVSPLSPRRVNELGNTHPS